MSPEAPAPKPASKNASTLRMVTKSDLGRQEWEACVEAWDEAGFWHRFDTQDSLKTWENLTEMSLAVRDDSAGGKVVALLPLQLTKGRFGARITRFIPWNSLDSLGGPAFAPGLGEKNRKRIFDFVRDGLQTMGRELKIKEITFSLPFTTPAWRGERCPRVNPLLEFGCQDTQGQSWAVDLRIGTKRLWDNLEGRARTAIRKAEKAEVTVRQAEGEEDLDHYYRLHCETYIRTGAKPRPKAYFEFIWRILRPQGLARIFIAEAGGEAVAAENFGVHKGAAFYWTGASSRKGLEVEGNSIIQWKAMEWMAAQGIEWYETGEAFPSARDGKIKGLSDFKKGFGGTMYPIYKGRIKTLSKMDEIAVKLQEIYNVARS
jgi:hypothetical protein